MRSFRSGREAAEAEGVRDDEDAREGHRTAGDEWVQIAERRERERCDVVREGPEEVALARRERPPREADRIADCAQVAADEGQVTRLDCDVRARAECEPEIRLRERRRVV